MGTLALAAVQNNFIGCDPLPSQSPTSDLGAEWGSYGAHMGHSARKSQRTNSCIKICRTYTKYVFNACFATHFNAHSQFLKYLYMKVVHHSICYILHNCNELRKCIVALLLITLLNC